MNAVKNLYYKIKTAVERQMDKMYEGKNREVITFVISTVINTLLIAGAIAVLVIRALNWQKHPLTANLIVLYLITFVFLVALIQLLKYAKRFAKYRQSKKGERTSAENNADVNTDEASNHQD